MLTQSRYLGKSHLTSIEDDKTYHGLWWLHGHPTNKIQGVLSLKVEGGIYLSLIGSFKSDIDTSDFAEHGIIYGEIVPTLGSITLFHCQEFERRISHSTAQKFKAKYLIYGLHENQFEKLLFTRFTFGATYLVDFLNPRLVEVNFRSNLTTISTKQSNQMRVKVTGAEIQFESEADYAMDLPHKEAIVEYSWVDIRPENPINIKDFEEKFLTPILNLVQFGTTFLNSVTFIKVYSTDGSNGQHVVRSENVKKADRGKSAIIHDRLFGLDDLQNPDQFVNNWFKCNDKLKHIFELYFSSLLLDEQFIVTQFLNIAQATESYHSEKFKTTFEASEKAKSNFKLKKQEILNKVDDQDMKVWLKENLKYFTELRLRLEELINETEDILNPIVKKKEDFINRVVKSRNYYTHYNPDLKDKAAERDELLALFFILRVILTINLILDCGIGKEQCKKIIHKNYMFISSASLIRDNKFTWAL